MTRCYRLDGAHCTLLLALLPDGAAAIMHWGSRLAADLDLSRLDAFVERPPRPNGLDEDVPSAQLYAGAGSGRHAQPAFAAHRGGRGFAASLAFAVKTEPGRLVLRGSDAATGIGADLELALAPGADVLAMRATLRNLGDADLVVDRMAAGVFRLPAGAVELTTFAGSWAREFAVERGRLGSGVWLKENRRGRTSHDAWPTMFVGAAAGSWGFHLGWSGNSRLAIERLDDGGRLVQLGESFESGEVILAQGEAVQSPWSYASFVPGPAGDPGSAFRRFVRNRMALSGKPRPVTFNTWEGTYFAHDLQSLKAQAELAARLGAERFVLDDGWFGRRDDDTSSLGDWQVDRRKYPDGLGPLVSHVRGLGMEFGLWIEPEMINPQSELHRAHPDWVLRVAGRPMRTSRHQLVLDLTRNEAFDHILGRLDALLRHAPIAALKWDMNRDLVDAGDALGRPAYRRQCLAAYDMMAQLRAAHPSLEIESCASGGGRADLGIMQYAQRIWTSDCTDALERLRIHRGILSLFPPEVLGAHLSANPNHLTGRHHSLAFRALAALPYHFGIELDPRTLPESEIRELAAWIALHKRLRPLFHGGEMLVAEPAGGRSLLGAVAKDGGRAAFICAQENMAPGERPPPLRLPGLDPSRLYRIAFPAPQDEAKLPLGASLRQSAARGDGFPGSLLSEVGLPLAGMGPETAFLMTLAEVEGTGQG